MNNIVESELGQMGQRITYFDSTSTEVQQRMVTNLSRNSESNQSQSVEILAQMAKIREEIGALKVAQGNQGGDKEVKIHSLTIIHNSCFVDQMLESLVLSQSDTFPNLKRLKLFEEMSKEIHFDKNYFPLKSLISRSSLEYLECNGHLLVEAKFTWL